METIWFPAPRTNTFIVNTIPYRSWQDFMDCKPYHTLKPYFVSSWAWKNNTVQLIFMLPGQLDSLLTYIEFPVKREDEPGLRIWLKSHMHPSWKI